MVSHGTPKWFDKLPLDDSAHASLDNMQDTYERGSEALSESDPRVAAILQAHDDKRMTDEDAIAALDLLAHESIS